MKASALLLLVLQVTSAPSGLPDPTKTPGATNPVVTQATVATTICQSGWTSTVRPPSWVTSSLKADQMKAWNLPGGPKDYEEDHLIPLELGGAPDGPKNLWPQAYAGQWGARVKDRLETELKRRVCGGTMTLDVAQKAIATDWIAAWKLYVVQ